MFSRDAFKDQSFGEDVFSGGALKGLAEVLARIRHAGRICLAAEVLSIKDCSFGEDAFSGGAFKDQSFGEDVFS